MVKSRRSTWLQGLRALLAAVTSVTLACSAVPALADPSTSGSEAADRVPVVPRFQGPYSAAGFDPGQELWGIALVITGSIAGGLGLFALERSELSCEGGRCVEMTSGDPELGTGLLVGGIFIAGVGLYLIATAGDDAPTIVVDRLMGELLGAFELVDVVPVEGGGVVSSRVVF